MVEAKIAGQTCLFSAPVVIVSRDLMVRNGCIAVQRGRIVDVGPVAEIAAKYPDRNVKYFPGIFMPGLVNAHMHLELSAFPGDGPLSLGNTFTDWVEQLIARRISSTLSEEEMEAAAVAEMARQHAAGVVLIGDIGNTQSGLRISDLDGPVVYRMIEFLGANNESCSVASERLQNLDNSIPATAHAPYSTKPELLQVIKSRCVQNSHVFSIHTAEVAEEKTFIDRHSGMFRDFLVKKGIWDDTFFMDAPQSSSTVEYFSNLGLLNEGTLLVHCVHVSDEDLKIIQASGAHICICPESNSYLHSGVAPVDAMINHGIIPAIGTDSRASNTSLDMWSEMKRIGQEHPCIDARDIFAMVTIAGARALHFENDFGSLEIGKKAIFLHISSEKIQLNQTENEILQELMSGGRPDTVEWVYGSGCYGVNEGNCL